MAGCTCGGNCETNLIYACSGAANTGNLSDQVMRALSRNKVGASTCLAAMGADLSVFCNPPARPHGTSFSTDARFPAEKGSLKKTGSRAGNTS